MPLPQLKTIAILRNISRYVALTNKETEIFLSHLSLRRLKRRQYLLQEGDICRHESYVLSGCLRAYYIERDGFEHITMFAVEDWWISDLASLVAQTPAMLTIEALEDSEVLQIERSALEQLYEKVPKFERVFRILFQNAFIAHQHRIRETIARTAQERYDDFAVRYPAILARVPQKHIARYLGMTPEFLSRIRQRRTKQRRSH